MADFRVPEDMTPEEMMAEQVRAARRYLADHESGRRPLSRRELQTWRQVIEQWGKLEKPEDGAAR